MEASENHRDRGRDRQHDSSANKSGDNKTATASAPKPVDEPLLAAMLRESADIVERGEFDPILYNALQDFRAYYKAHYPKKKTHSISSGGTDRERSRSRTRTEKRSGSGNISVSSADDSLSKQQQQPKPKMVNDESEAKPASNKSLGSELGVTSPTSVESSSRPLADVPVSNETMDSSDRSAAKEEVFIEPASTEAVAPAMIPAATPVPEVATTVPQAPQGSHFINTAIPLKTDSARASNHPPAATIQKATANMIFGKLGMKFIPKNMVPTAAFTATSKKNAERAKEDLQAFQGELAQQAESSRRRKGLGDVKEGWCETHFTMNCACLETTSTTPKNDPTSRPFSQSHHGEQATPSPVTKTAAGTTSSEIPQPQAQHQAHDVPAVPSAQQQQHQQQPPPSSTSFNVNTPRGASAGDASEAASSQATVDSTAAVQAGGSTNPFGHDPAVGPSTQQHQAAVSNSAGGDQMLHHGQPSSSATATSTETHPPKPDFQRPVNQNSNLVANGWIEQQRRSKMRFVWKEVLASLVLGRKPGEETTLWIQREVINPMTGKKELEALHQIPIKLMESCTYLDFTSDNRFTLKVFNATEEFLFRCRTDSAANKWVLTLQQHVQMAKGNNPAHANGERGSRFEEEKKGPDNQNMSVGELRAICHGAGINTSGMERRQLEAAAEEVRRRGTFFPTPPGAPPPFPIPHSAGPPPPQQQQPQERTQSAPVPEMPHAQGASSNSNNNNKKLSISELRAICHGAGINTAGMERGQLERAANEVLSRGTFFPPPNSHPAAPHSGGSHSAPPPTQATHTAPPTQPQPHSAPAPESTQERLSVSELRAICHGAGINTVGMERKQLEAAAEEVRKRGTYFDAPSAASSTTSSSQIPSSAASAPGDLQHEAAKRREAEEQAVRRAKEDYNRQKTMEEEQRRRVAAEQEHQRRMAEQHAAEQRRRYAEQQAAWQKQQHEEEHRRRMAEQHVAEQRRQQEEAARIHQQQWQQQQKWQQQWHQQQQQKQQQWPPRQPQSQQQQPQWQQQQQRGQPPPQQQRHPTPPPQQNQQQQQQNAHHSAASEKYAKMANQTEEGGQAVVTRIKHDLLIHWALQPPQLQMLRPIDALVTSIHKVFPPALGVPAHDYFQKWKPLGQSDVANAAGLPDEERLKKAVRKIRFFLHPDKLPKDLNTEQSFMVKMLWDVTSDAWEEYEKRKEDLDWIR